jgi:DNA-directed RNA polymerase subunit H (RpoH/RPB5)
MCSRWVPNVASGEVVKLVTAREAVDRAFEYRQQAAGLRDQARRLELEGRVPMHQAVEKEEATRTLEKARAMWTAADTAEATAQEYRRQVPHNQMN